MRTTQLLALTTALITVASAAPLAEAAEPTIKVPVICDGIGADTVLVTGRLGQGGSARIAKGPLQVSGTAGFTGRDQSGKPVHVAANPDGTSDGTAICRATRPVHGEVTQLVPAQTRVSAANGRNQAPTGTTVTGTWTFAVNVAPVRTAAAAGTSVPTTAFPFASTLQRYVNSRPGNITVALRRLETGTTHLLTKGASRNVTASIVKVQIMAAVMRKAQASGRALSSWEKGRLIPMIKQSDNNATTALYNYIGGYRGLRSSATDLGLARTVADPAGHWGLTTTDAVDQTLLMRHFGADTGKLNSANRSYGRYLMRNVRSDQRWGVTAGAPTGSIAVKNGWLPRSDGWHVNSIGLSSSAPAYTIGVLTSGNPGSMSGQVATIEGVSRIIRAHLNQLVAPARRGVPGDFTGNGTPEVAGVDSNGNLVVWPGDGRGNLSYARRVATGWGNYNWIGSPGDIDRDGIADLLARKSDGTLTCWISTGTLAFAARPCGVLPQAVSYTALQGVGGKDDLSVLALQKGALMRYPITDKTGALGRPIAMSGNFGTATRILNAGDLNGDRRADLRVISSDGTMRAWYGTGSGWNLNTSWRNTGWQKFPLVGAADLDRDGRMNLVTATATNFIIRDGAANAALTVWTRTTLPSSNVRKLT